MSTLNAVFKISLGLFILSGCSSTQVKRMKSTDPGLRVLIDPAIPAEHAVEIRRALVESGKFEVVDRREGFEAAIREQNLQYRSGYADRFSDREKWMHIGAMYGAASIVTAHADCYQKKSFWGSLVRECRQNLTFINGRTGVVELAVSDVNSVYWTTDWLVPDWDKVIAKMIDKYPEFFEPRKIEKPLEKYMDQSEELARREKDKQHPPPSVQERKPAQQVILSGPYSVQYQNEVGGMKDTNLLTEEYRKIQNQNELTEKEVQSFMQEDSGL